MTITIKAAVIADLNFYLANYIDKHHRICFKIAFLLLSSACAANYTSCGNSNSCVPDQYICDEFLDCDNGADEAGCGESFAPSKILQNLTSINLWDEIQDYFWFQYYFKLLLWRVHTWRCSSFHHTFHTAVCLAVSSNCVSAITSCQCIFIWIVNNVWGWSHTTLKRSDKAIALLAYDYYSPSHKFAVIWWIPVNLPSNVEFHRMVCVSYNAKVMDLKGQTNSSVSKTTFRT